MSSTMHLKSLPPDYVPLGVHPKGDASSTSFLVSLHAVGDHKGKSVSR